MTSSPGMDSDTPRAPVRAVPEDYGSVTPYVVSGDAVGLLDWMVEVFDAVDRGRMLLPDGSVGHGEVLIGNRVVNVISRQPGWPVAPAFLSAYVEDADAVHARALAAGATEATPAVVTAWGDRTSRVLDPFGNLWWLQSHVEDVPPDEMTRRLSDERYVAAMTTLATTGDAAMRALATRPS